MVGEAKRYLVIVRLKEPVKDRAPRIGPKLKPTLEKDRLASVEVAFASDSGAISGFFVRSTLHANKIRDLIDAPGNARYHESTPTILDGGDTVLVVQIGDDWSVSEGLGRVASWLQKR